MNMPYMPRYKIVAHTDSEDVPLYTVIYDGKIVCQTYGFDNAQAISHALNVMAEQQDKLEASLLKPSLT